MEIRVNWNEVIKCEPHIEGDDCYTISFLFKNGQVCTYGYNNNKEFIKDYTNIMCRGNLEN